jgi:ParB family transcriptional regulator, chromosome partitioning protein
MLNKGKRQALGRGLGALIPTAKTAPQLETASPAKVFDCPVSKISPNRQQPRQSFDEEKLKELTESIREKGIVQPLIVRSHNGAYQIVAGERRWRAARLAGLEAVPVIVKELSDTEALQIALIENLQREDLNPLEEAEAYQQLIDEHGMVQEDVAKKVGKQRSSVANTLRLLKLPEEVQRLLATGQISMGHARTILGLVGASSQTALAKRVVQEGLSVRACEELVRQSPPERRSQLRAKPRQTAYSPAEFRLIEAMQLKLGTKVDLKAGKKGGKMIIHYYSPVELDRIIAVIEGR